MWFRNKPIINIYETIPTQLIKRESDIRQNFIFSGLNPRGDIIFSLLKKNSNKKYQNNKHINKLST